MMRIALITSRQSALAEFRAGLENHGFRVTAYGDAWDFLRTGLKQEWSLVILDGAQAQIRSFLEKLLEAESGVYAAVMTEVAPVAFQSSVDGLGVLCPLPVHPAAGDVEPLLEKLRAAGALAPEVEAAQACLDALKARHHPHCVVCWDRHPFGLQVDYCVASVDTVEGTFDCGKSYEGYAGILHGGIVSTLLDGAMVSCLMAKGLEGYTVDLRVRYHTPVATGRPATVRAVWLKGRGRLHWLQASLEQDGKMHARARATFLQEPPSRRARPGVTDAEPGATPQKLRTQVLKEKESSWTRTI